MLSSLQNKISDSKALFDFDGHNLYGLRARPYSIGAQPDNAILYLDHFEAVEYLDQQGIKIGSSVDIRHGLLAYKLPLPVDLVASYELIHIDKPVDAEALLLTAKRAIVRSGKLQQKLADINSKVKTFESDVNNEYAQQKLKQVKAELQMVAARITANDAQIQAEFSNYVKANGDRDDWDQMAYEADDRTEKYNYTTLEKIAE